MLNDAKYDFSKETDIKEKLYAKCMEKKSELDKKKVAQTRVPVTLDELEGKTITRIEPGIKKEKELKLKKSR